jgi:site-specific DNA-methyltransferase (cytosine-N4-specific)
MPMRLTEVQLVRLYEILALPPTHVGIVGERWTRSMIAQYVFQEYGVTYHPNYLPVILEKVEEALLASALSTEPFFQSEQATLLNGDALAVLSKLPQDSVDCIITSPPYYGQRDYGVPNQIGLEPHPQDYINRLLEVFREAKRVLKPTGSLWVNLGDTYWSGKGKPKGDDRKQKYRRFLRPQDKSGPRPLCTPKQLLLIPHRFAIAMQDDGWIVRNDNVWHKMNPTPDPVIDRSASAHEYMFHFVKQRRYFYNSTAVAVPSKGERALKAPSSVWTIKSASTFKKHIATFPEELVRIPVLATLPSDGVMLDPFCGSGTAITYALKHNIGRHAIGIDVSPLALEEAKAILESITRPLLD